MVWLILGGVAVSGLGILMWVIHRICRMREADEEQARYGSAVDDE
jgi:hypothetical protein